MQGFEAIALAIKDGAKVRHPEWAPEQYITAAVGADGAKTFKDETGADAFVSNDDLFVSGWVVHTAPMSTEELLKLWEDRAKAYHAKSKTPRDHAAVANREISRIIHEFRSKSPHTLPVVERVPRGPRKPKADPRQVEIPGTEVDEIG